MQYYWRGFGNHLNGQSMGLGPQTQMLHSKQIVPCEITAEM